MQASYRWIILIVIFATTVAGMATWACAFSLLTVWTRELGVSHAQGGFVLGLFYLAAIVVSIPASWLFQRFPSGRVFQISWLLVAAGTVILAFATGFWSLCAGRFLVSLGLNVHLVGAPKAIAAWFEGRKELGFAMAVYSMGISLGVFCGLRVISGLSAGYGWRASLYMLAGAAAAGCLLVGIISPPGVLPGAEPQRSLRLQGLGLGWTVWVLATGYFFFNIGSDSFLAFTPDYLAGRSYSIAAASGIVGSYAWSAILTKLTTAPALRARNAAFFVLGGCVLGMLSDVAVLQQSIPPRFAALTVGVAFGLAMPALYAMPIYLFGGERSGFLYGLYQFFNGFGIAAQTLIGYTYDRTHGYLVAYALMFSFFFLGFICIFLLRDAPRTRMAPASVEQTVGH